MNCIKLHLLESCPGLGTAVLHRSRKVHRASIASSAARTATVRPGIADLGNSDCIWDHTRLRLYASSCKLSLCSLCLSSLNNLSISTGTLYIILFNTMEEEYYCNCEIRCKGRRYISRASHFCHKKYQDRLSMYTPAMQDFLNDNPITVQLLSLHVVQSLCVCVAGQSDKNTNHTIGPPNKCVQQSGSDDNNAVGTSSWGQCTVLTELLRTTYSLALLKAHLYSLTHC